MKTINLTQNYHFTTEISDEGFHYELILTKEDNLITLYRVDSEFEKEEYLCAQGVLPVLKEIVTSIICYYSNGRTELGDMYENCLNVLIHKLYSPKELKSLMKVHKVNFSVDLVETLLTKGKLDYLKD